MLNEIKRNKLWNRSFVRKYYGAFIVSRSCVITEKSSKLNVRVSEYVCRARRVRFLCAALSIKSSPAYNFWIFQLHATNEILVIWKFLPDVEYYIWQLMVSSASQVIQNNIINVTALMAALSVRVIMAYFFQLKYSMIFSRAKFTSDALWLVRARYGYSVVSESGGLTEINEIWKYDKIVDECTVLCKHFIILHSRVCYCSDSLTRYSRELTP